MAFLEALFMKEGLATGVLPGQWRDRSTAEYFVFESNFGILQLRRRISYPQAFAYTQGSTLCFGYGAQALGYRVLSKPLHDVTEDLFYEQEFLYAEVDLAGRTVKLQRDARCTLPIFVSEDTRQIALTSEYERAAVLVQERERSADFRCVLQASLGLQSHWRTLLAQVRCVYDRARLTYQSGRMSITEPPDGSLATKIRSRNSNPREFRERLNATLENYQRRYAPEGNIACLLSAGSDSSVLCGYYADSGVEFEGVSFRYPAEYGVSQAEKLKDLSERFQFRDHALPLDPTVDFPLASIVMQGMLRPYYHAQNVYQYPTLRTLEHYKAKGTTALFNGIGGDELFESVGAKSLVTKCVELELKDSQTLPGYFTGVFRAQYEHMKHTAVDDYRPVTLQSYSVVKCGFYIPDVHFTYDIWPVSPLADPKLYAYCQRLPLNFRRNKKILRAYMKAYGYPSSVHAPAVNEDFEPFLDGAIRQQLLPWIRNFFRRGSVLADSGLIDPTILLHDCEQVESGMDGRAQAAFNLLFVTNVEINLQAVGISRVRTES